MPISFTKMHGLGNDFVVVDAVRQSFEASPTQLAWLADRRFGVGCDQILVVDPAPSAEVDFGYRIYNADGSTAGQCGNGARCLARFIRARGLSTRTHLRVRTLDRTMELQALDDGRVRVDMGAPRFAPEAIPMHAPAAAVPQIVILEDGLPLPGIALSMGNPHFVIEVDEIERAPVEAIGEALQEHTAFPERVNVGFVQFVDRAHARLRVHERGAGETLACGSGACAAMVAGRLLDRLDARARLSLRGGDLELEWAGRTLVDADPVWMTGPAQTVFEGSFEWPS